MFGIVNLFKPAGLTSRTALNNLLRLLPRRTKAGHAGTLDPIATGVLLVCVGSATRLISRVQTLEKVYEATFRLGYASDSLDCECQYSAVTVSEPITREKIDNILPAFTGTIEQVPPVFSALKVNGQRAYDLARRGEQVELPPRPIEIHELELLDFIESPETIDGPHGPILGSQMKLRIRCGSGTYVRSLGRDIAFKLGTNAIMTELERIAIGPFTSATSSRLEDYDRQSIDQVIESPVKALLIPKIKLTDFEIGELAVGRAIPMRAELENANMDECQGVDAHNNLVAILGPRSTNPQTLHPVINFANRYSSPDRRNT